MQLTNGQQTALTHALGQLMSAWSENHYLAGWMNNLENDLPVLVREIVNYTINGDTEKYGIADFRDAWSMWHIARMLGHWAQYVTDPAYEFKPYTPSGYDWSLTA